MVKDIHQNLLVMTSSRAGRPKLKKNNFAQQSHNEFAGREELSLFKRLIRKDFPVHTLSMQYRMHSLIAKISNHR